MSHRLFALATIPVALIGSTASSAITYRTIALSNQSAPGTPPGVVFSRVGPPVINTAGDVAFRGVLAGPGIIDFNTNGRGYWSDAGGALQLLARQNDQYPGGGSATLSLHSEAPFLNDHGQVLFFARESSQTGSAFGLWQGTSTGLTAIAKEGAQAPDVPGAQFSANYPDAALAASGATGFAAQLQGPGITNENDYGIWSSQPGATLELVARAGGQAPGCEPGVVFDGPTFLVGPKNAVNDSGDVAFWGRIRGENLPSTANTGIWSGRAGSVNLVAREGSWSPGFASDVNFLAFAAYAASNNADQIAFLATVGGPSLGFGDKNGIWKSGSLGLELVAHEDQIAPGAEGRPFGSFLPPLVAGNGDVIIRGFASGGTTTEGLWAQRDSSLELIIRTGTPAPGLTPAAWFWDMPTELPAVNANGQIAVRMTLAGTGIDSANNDSLWATNLSGELAMILREGAMFQVAPGDVRTVKSFFLWEGSGGQDGRLRSFNDAGELAFSVEFTDGSSGAFVAVVPEPSVACLLAVGAVVIACRFRRAG